MNNSSECQIIHHWMRFTKSYRMLEQKIESRIREKAGLCLNDFYLLYYLGESRNHEMKLQDACENDPDEPKRLVPACPTAGRIQ